MSMPIMEAEDLLVLKDLEIRKLKERLAESEAWAKRLLAALDEALATIRSLKKPDYEMEELKADPSRMDWEREDGRAW